MGGQNRTHDCTAGHKQLDSFYFGKCIPLMERKGLKRFDSSFSWTDGASIGVVLYPDRLGVRYSATYDGKREEIREELYFETVENNYGGPPRYYFICPYCGRRCRLLYLHGQYFKCRTCAQLNYYSQQVTAGTDEAAHRMKRFIKEKFGVHIQAPAEAVYYCPTRPKGMHQTTFDQLRDELEKLQRQYNQQFAAMVYSQFGIR